MGPKAAAPPVLRIWGEAAALGREKDTREQDLVATRAALHPAGKRRGFVANLSFMETEQVSTHGAIVDKFLASMFVP